MFQEFLIKKMLKVRGVPEEQIEVLLRIVEKNPELFQTIAKEVEVRVKSGMSQADASMQVMKKYEQELKKLA